jgi:energy-coupling factor transporter ATP-binding protein EcfA2
VSVCWSAPRGRSPLLAGQFPDLEIFAEVVGDEVTWAATARGVPRSAAAEEAERMFSVLELPESFPERRTWDLSAGEKRLVQLVAALIAPVPLLCLDEPTCGLDPERRSRIAALVRRRAEQVPTLVASQDVHWLEEVSADRVSLSCVDAEFGK